MIKDPFIKGIIITILVVCLILVLAPFFIFLGASSSPEGMNGERIQYWGELGSYFSGTSGIVASILVGTANLFLIYWVYSKQKTDRIKSNEYDLTIKISELLYTPDEKRETLSVLKRVYNDLDVIQRWIELGFVENGTQLVQGIIFIRSTIHNVFPPDVMSRIEKNSHEFSTVRNSELIATRLLAEEFKKNNVNNVDFYKLHDNKVIRNYYYYRFFFRSIDVVKDLLKINLREERISQSVFEGVIRKHEDVFMKHEYDFYIKNLY
ncbi:hypothetical protein SAMN05216474_1183 [Lishizhenia tianjinensis]|uniref:Phage abortive infection protein n=1 Tax=Lishizhenia tianjinensis TaxID=477690 RepID=A0A1I6YUX2_9FLAO|nr:hypothetical protein [Lishizhenia tianjinensis]SFT54021.1 hypothetical protein SAMN05216474_1183 [Lishizhenia tianjinensis]